MKPATTISTLFLTVVALAHAARLIAGWPVTVDGFDVPLWFSGAAALVVGCLAVGMMVEQRRTA